MPIRRVQIIGIIDVDTDAYDAAAVEEETTPTGETLGSEDAILADVAGHFMVEDLIPRWARDAITFRSESYTVTDPGTEPASTGTTYAKFTEEN